MKKIAKKLSLSREIVRPLQHVVGGITVTYTQYIQCLSLFGRCATGDCNETAGSACDNRQCTATH